MRNYKEAYKSLMKETEKAIQILIDAQIKCEEIFMATEADEDEGGERNNFYMSQQEYEEAFELLENCRMEMLKKFLAKDRLE